MRHTCKNGRAAFIPAIICLLFLGLAGPWPRAQQACEFYLNSCPRDFDGDTIRVPSSIIAMGPRVHGCAGDSTGGDSAGAPSIMFVIDNSGSMKGTTGNDPTGSRFTVTRALLDTIAKRQPQAEVCIIVFR
jgi:hypothetical protein